MSAASRRAKATLAAAIGLSALTIWAVHFQQEQQHETMYQGVLRDDERRREKREKREEELRESQRKREIYEKVQRVESDNQKG
ncbi:hypothetical protein MIND_00034700 [Mycena indigotica]|uniref:Cytochrome c oxidase assembly protein n=1 Tax=Mycena indigotica TaxID=2126181 RepID=A0A8H6TCJ8_9AGAR|nr:uncharacterized protein MIND_00034700 [Mycena indigotica]KAF7315203.1 hypothetical protein MIND_00034700 [Mycena indigotica]